MTAKPKTKALTPISVVMPTYNREALLEAAVDSVLKQEFDDEFELIVVNDGSTDNTESLLRRIQKDRGQRLRFVSQPNKGPASARNRGLELAEGWIVAYIDDDCEAASDWLQKISSGYEEDSKLAGVGGQTFPADKGNIFTRYLDFRVLRKPHREKDGTITFLLTNNCSFRKAMVEEAGRFDEAIPVPGGEDVDLCVKLRAMGYRFSYNPDAKVTHHHKVTTRGFIRMCLNYGYGEVIRLRKFSPAYKIVRQAWWGRVLLAGVWIPLEAWQFWKHEGQRPLDSITFAILHWLQRTLSYFGGFRAWRQIISEEEEKTNA